MRDNPSIIDGRKSLNAPDRIVHYYDIVHVEQAKGLRYEQMVDRFIALSGHQEISNNYDLLIDGTGIGDAVVERLRDKGLYPIPIIFTGGEQVHEVAEEIGRVFGNVPGKLSAMHTVKEIRVPKQDMIDAGVLLMQQDRVHLAVGLPLADEVERQINAFKGNVNKRTGNKKYEADEDEIHDDITVCYLMSAWWILRGRKDSEVRERALPMEQHTSVAYEPFDYM